MPTTLRCPQCDGEMSLTPLETIEGEEHGVHLRIDGLPAMRCPNSHTRFVAPTFPTRFLDELLALPQLVPLDTAGKKGLLRRRYCCPVCGEALDPRDASQRVQADRSLAFDGLSAFGVHVDLPAYRCPACAHECVEPGDALASDLMNASAHAFRSAHIAPG